jgi:hypothetical protein
MRLAALRHAKTSSPLVRQCQKALNISIHSSVGLLRAPAHSGGRGNETAEEFATEGTFYQFTGPEPALGVSRHNTRYGAGRTTSIRQCGGVFPTDWPQALVLLLRLGYCPWYNPGLLLATLLDITPCEDSPLNPWITDQKKKKLPTSTELGTLCTQNF